MIVPDWAGYMRFRSRFEEVIDPRLYSLEWLDQRVLKGTAFFIRSEHAAVIIEVRTYPLGFREVHGLIAAGDLGEIINELIPAAEEWGREHGCQAAVIESRPGWAKQLKSSGYEVAQVAVRKEF